ncbi:hypothetical protein [Yersinia mollaretii]|uniref:hypothetical protein n=1 Tax=Yersinia mollaretii TaxID=33060 RepID=UPI0005DD55EA|nr:hypothetical protein [Yersinia mollaretii]MDN0112374.1 hypothetical protein [Yersinia mollaretii]PJE87464.1 hypothetical protein CU280_12200 [Yersinia mollaretii]CQD37913.1 Uncharacterised protein [Yersinia mollaretii]CQH04641.1 Uncharacterised protein [Yersinia mollaretii]
MSSSFLSTTPNQLGSGVLPSDYDEIVFELSEANWVKDIILPDQPSDRCIVTIYSAEAKDSVLHLPLGSLRIKSNSEYYLEYHEDIKRWDILGPDFNYLKLGDIDDYELQDNMSHEILDSTGHITIVPITTDNHNEVDEFSNEWMSEEYSENRQQWHNRELDVNDDAPDLIVKNRSTRSVIEDYGTKDSSAIYFIPENPQKVTDYMMDNNNWTSEIRLPPTAEDESTITINSTAIRDSKVSAENLLYPSTTTITSGDQYIFKYLKRFNRWVLESAPIRNVEFDHIQSEIPFPTSQTTLVTMTDSHWRDNIKLPEQAADRDKITLKSSTDAVTHIDVANVNEPGVMTLGKGEQYDFFYIAEKGKWQLISSPDTLYQAQDMTNGNIPTLHTPRTIINAANGNYQPELRLPTEQEAGSRIIINSSAEWDISVSTDETHYKVLNGETVAFKVDKQGLWQRETITIDLLLLYSDKAVAHSGRDKVHDFMMQGFGMTNEALENSGANFRYRVVGLREIAAKADWIDMPGMLDKLREDLLVQAWRDTLKADGIYYVGTEDLCGRGWLNNFLSPMDPMYMVSVGSIICDPEVMRHELGHNMGADDKYGCDPDTQECELIATIMNQMWVDYYSTPDRYTADYGIPMGIAGKFDDVLTMNKMSSVVAAYR